MWCLWWDCVFSVFWILKQILVGVPEEREVPVWRDLEVPRFEVGLEVVASFVL